MDVKADTSAEQRRDVQLTIGGMTCASCPARIEKKLNKMPGVTASVNYATEKAQVSYPPDVAPQDLVATVEATGYTAALPTPPTVQAPDQGTAAREQETEAHAWRQRLLISGILTLSPDGRSALPVVRRCIEEGQLKAQPQQPGLLDSDGCRVRSGQVT